MGCIEWSTRRAGKNYQKGNQKKKATKESQKGEPERIVVSKNSQHPAKPIQNWNSNGAKFGVNVLGLILMVLGVQIFADFSLLRCEKKNGRRPFKCLPDAPETFQDAKKPPQDITQDASEEPTWGFGDVGMVS